MTDLRLTEGQTNTDVWNAVRSHYLDRIASLRVKAENLGLSEQDRRDFLVRIDEIKRLLAAGEPVAKKKPITTTTAGY